MCVVWLFMCVLKMLVGVRVLFIRKRSTSYLLNYFALKYCCKFECDNVTLYILFNFIIFRYL